MATAGTIEQGTQAGAAETARRQDEMSVNVGETERWVSGIGGGLLALMGIKKGGIVGWLAAAIGGSLIYRGTTGYCSLYNALKIDTAHSDVHPANRSFHIDRSIVVERPIEEVYRFWHNVENLPQFMEHLESVKVVSAKHSHWVAKAPAGRTVEWGAEIINDKENEVIAWRSLPEADVYNAGSVRFKRALDGRGTEVRVIIDYRPPAGALGVAAAKLFGEDPDTQIADDLQRFKSVMETGKA